MEAPYGRNLILSPYVENRDDDKDDDDLDVPDGDD